MILKALVDYYHRLLDDPDVDIAPFGFERKAIDFIIILEQNGNFSNLLDVRQREGKKRKGRIFLVPKAVKRTAGIKPNLLWDTLPYTLGIATPDPKKDMTKLAHRALEQHEAFVNEICEVFGNCNDPGIMAVLAFFEGNFRKSVFSHQLWPELETCAGNLSFRLQGDELLICQRPQVRKIILEKTISKAGKQTCAISGEQDVPAELHTAIKGVWGAQSSGANIVSFNLDAFRSFGKKQGYNAPIGQRAEFAYTTALNYLLASEKQRIQVGDASTVFWAQEACDLEDDFFTLIGQPKKGEQAVNYDKIRGLLTAVKTGIPPTEEKIAFYVLGLAPNASRIAVRFWYEGNVKEIKERIARHFEDISIIRASYDPEYLSLFQLLLSLATEHKADNIPPNLAGELARAVLYGTNYPRSVLAATVQRCKAEQQINFAQASLIKGFLARDARLSENKNKEVGMALDKTYNNIGYVLGRLFAVLERIQEQAQGAGLNKTIRDTYFGAASSSPLVTFRRLQDLSIHHLAKIRNSGKSTIWLEKLLGEVEDLLPPQGIPAILTLEDQGRFAVGYYHQRQDFFKTNDNRNGKGDE
ncbi:MAG: type I-C CRISPR-associated protein Cas8c/Csd1 [Deltaproteobacteria bacterium]|nr:MAG: type I-C CRISPR-associated protein Cas8c/Csd1 [Deltaproteobacteria bacterium]